MIKRFLRPHCIIVSIAIILFIWLLNSIRLNLHYIDPFNNGIKEYEITDIVYSYIIKDTDFQEDRIVIVNSGKPDRRRLADLTTRLTDAGAAAIGLDFYFDEVYGAPEDTLLQNSIKANPNIVLACSLADENTDDDTIEGVTAVDTFFSNYATIGYGNYPSNETKTIRVFSPGEMAEGQYIPAFTTAILAKYKPEAAQKFSQRRNKLEHIYFSGHKENFISQDINIVLDSLTSEEFGYVFKDRIVLIGYAPSDEWANPLIDRHYSPINKNYDTKSIPDMFGIVIHANVLSMILNEQYIYNVPWGISFLLSLVLCYFNVVFIRYIYRRFHEGFHGITRALQLVEFLLMFFLIAILFYYFRIKLNLGMGILAVVLAYDFIMIYESLIRPRVPLLQRLPETLESKVSLPILEEEGDKDINAYLETPHQHTSTIIATIPSQDDKMEEE